MGKIIEFSMVTVWDWAIQLFALGLIIFILSKLLFKPVSDFLEKRKAAIAEDINSAEASRKDAEDLKAQYEAKLNNIQQEADEILKEARAKAMVREQSIIEAAKEEAQAIKDKAADDIKLEQERVKAEMKSEMIEVATLMAGKFVASSMDDNKQNELIKEITDEMGDVQWLN